MENIVDQRVSEIMDPLVNLIKVSTFAFVVIPVIIIISLVILLIKRTSKSQKNRG